MTVEELKERKKELGYTNERIAQLADVPLSTVQKFFAGTTKHPRLATRARIEKVLTGHSDSVTDYLKDSAYRMVSVSTFDESTDYSAARVIFRHNIDDYYNLPDDQRVELIDGLLYDMASPSPVHQLVLLQIYNQLLPCMESHPECELYLAPLDVRLFKDDWNMLQPDLFILCSQGKISRRFIDGAPDFIIEIVSPSSKTHDMYRKLNLYSAAGVREYWIVVPEENNGPFVLVYDLENEVPPEKYTFEDRIPVLISHGSCSVDFKKIYAKIEPYL